MSAAMKLFRCEVVVDMMVLARDEREAQSVAVANVRHEAMFARCEVAPVESEDDLGNGWAASIPYARHSADHGDRSCRAILRAPLPSQPASEPPSATGTPGDEASEDGVRETKP